MIKDNEFLSKLLSAMKVYKKTYLMSITTYGERRRLLYKKYAELRDKAGVTDYEVSKNTGVATSTLSEWKKGTYTPKIDKIMKIAKYFGVSLEELIGETT